jgi:hypothetical protein
MSTTLTKSAFNRPASTLPARRKEQAKPALAHACSCLVEWLNSRADRLDSHRAPRLQLEFPDRFVNFRGMKEFEFALSSRIEFPATWVRELIALTPAGLEASATKIRLVERDFADILARAVHHPELIGEFLREIDVKLFSHDHGWRSIMEGLIRLSPAFDAYKRVALIKYMQSLRARQNIMRSLFIEKTRGDEGACIHATRTLEHTTAFAAGSTAIFDLKRTAADGPNANDVHADAAEAGQDVPADAGFIALAKGETVVLQLGEAREIVLLLAGNRLRLYTGRDFYMADDDDNTYPLHTGKNLIGRHSACDVVLDSACRAVSRNHLIVQPISAQEIRLTDLSSHGTEVPTRLLKRH